MKLTKSFLKKLILEELENFDELPVRKAIEKLRYMDPDEVTGNDKLAFSKHPAEVVRDYAIQKFGGFEARELIHEDEEWEVYIETVGAALSPENPLIIFVSKRGLTSRDPEEGIKFNYGTGTYLGIDPDNEPYSFVAPPDTDDLPPPYAGLFDDYMRDNKLWFYLNKYIAEGPLTRHPQIPGWIKREALDSYDYQIWQWDVEHWLENNGIYDDED